MAFPFGPSRDVSWVTLIASFSAQGCTFKETEHSLTIERKLPGRVRSTELPRRELNESFNQVEVEQACRDLGFAFGKLFPDDEE